MSGWKSGVVDHRPNAIIEFCISDCRAYQRAFSFQLSRIMNILARYLPVRSFIGGDS